ncbi:MAG: hypothetical protein ACKO85_17160 [Isosphaeraceae bacterium]
MVRIFKLLLLVIVCLGACDCLQAGDVSGEIRMPSTCSPEISPAVVWLVPLEPAKAGAAKAVDQSEKPAGLVLMRQSALQFVPRVVVLKKGQQVQFTNDDSEFHNVHVQARGELFNQTMPPGQPAIFSPATTGILNVFCNIHQHMRAFLILQDTPWITAIDRKGKFVINNVPEGRYTMFLWHEAGGRPGQKLIDMPAAGLKLEPILLADSASPSRTSLLTAKTTVTTWSDDVDQIVMRLSAAISAGSEKGQYGRAEKLAQEAFETDFKKSVLAQAVLQGLGQERATELEKQFQEFARLIREAAGSDKPDTSLAAKTMRSLVANLVRASDDLKTKGLVDRSKFKAK